MILVRFSSLIILSTTTLFFILKTVDECFLFLTLPTNTTWRPWIFFTYSAMKLERRFKKFLMFLKSRYRVSLDIPGWRVVKCFYDVWNDNRKMKIKKKLHLLGWNEFPVFVGTGAGASVAKHGCDVTLSVFFGVFVQDLQAIGSGGTWRGRGLDTPRRRPTVNPRVFLKNVNKI